MGYDPWISINISIKVILWYPLIFFDSGYDISNQIVIVDIIMINMSENPAKIFVTLYSDINYTLHGGKILRQKDGWKHVETLEKNEMCATVVTTGAGFRWPIHWRTLGTNTNSYPLEKPWIFCGFWADTPHVFQDRVVASSLIEERLTTLLCLAGKCWPLKWWRFPWISHDSLT